MFREPPLPNARNLEGSWVGLRLTDGSRIEGQLISAGAGTVQTLWLLVGEGDEFVPLGRVSTLWTYRPWARRDHFTVTARTQTSSSSCDGATFERTKSQSSAGDPT
jgi:hypothetical protein